MDLIDEAIILSLFPRMDESIMTSSETRVYAMSHRNRVFQSSYLIENKLKELKIHCLHDFWYILIDSLHQINWIVWMMRRLYSMRRERFNRHSFFLIILINVLSSRNLTLNSRQTLVLFIVSWIYIYILYRGLLEKALHEDRSRRSFGSFQVKNFRLL